MFMTCGTSPDCSPLVLRQLIFYSWFCGCDVNRDIYLMDGVSRVSSDLTQTLSSNHTQSKIMMDLSQLMTTLPQGKAQTVTRHLRVSTRGCVNHTSEGKVIQQYAWKNSSSTNPRYQVRLSADHCGERLITQPVTNQINAINDKH